MAEAITISNQYNDIAFDYKALRESALSLIQQRSGNDWTDHNIHDPGITIMELLCYAITDLSYRAALPIQDVLAKEGETGLPKPLYTAANILPARPLTKSDYRRLCIDTILVRDNGTKTGIKNAWLILETKNAYADFIKKTLLHKQPDGTKWREVIFKGYYDLLMEFDADAKKADTKALIELVRSKLQDNRNLCEDFLEIRQVEKALYRVCAEIELADNADPFEAMASIFVNIQQYLSPLVRFYSLSQMLAAGFTADQVFEGPLLQQGFLKQSELSASELRRDLRLSDIIQQIFNVPGVQNAVDVVIQAAEDTGKPLEKWILPIPDGKQPMLDTLTSRIVFYKNGVPFVPDKTRVQALFIEKMNELMADARQAVTDDLSFPIGSPLQLDDYTSIQHHFPKTYGIGHWGLDDSESDSRKVKALQLHGYLWVMEQLMGDYLAQLAQTSKLLASDPVAHTLHSKLVHDFKQSQLVLTQLNVVPPDLPAAIVSLTATLQSLAETELEFFSRRHALLDHLISRFAENFAGYVYTHDALFPAISQHVLIAQKEAFLNDYDSISRHRGGAHNYGLPGEVWDTTNISGYEKRVRRMLGIADNTRSNAVNFYITILSETDGGGNTVFRFAFLLKGATTETALIGTNAFEVDEDCQGEAEIAELVATDRANYSIREEAGKFVLELSDKTPALIARCPILFDDENAANTFLDKILEQLARPVEEAMLVIEHLLLMPSDKLDQWLSICVDGNCEDCACYDPYSFRLSVVLPADAGRFTNMDFRRFAEQLIRREVPAHLLPKVCWISSETYSQLEDAWKGWLEFKAGLVPEEEEPRLKALIAALENCKTVYPKARLQDCSSDQPKQLLVLNQASLGTLKNS
ncbi:hypothetical protein BH10BAC3_BH10BAC3_08460 [soil metagenome]